jgi:alpha-L-fucosidase
LFGEGPTEISEGAFTDTKRAAFTGQDIRFTTKGEILYAIALAWPGQQVIIHSLAESAGLWDRSIATVSLLGHPGSLEWSYGEQGLTIILPDLPPCEHAFVFRIGS